MIRATLRCLPAIVPLVLAACSSAAGYPSLGLRDVERIAARSEPADMPILPPPSSDLVRRLSGLVSAAQAADRQFRDQQGSTAAAVSRAAGAAAASDSWASAQIALGKLESSRSPAVAALAELDTLYADARNAEPAGISPSAEAIADARERVSDLVAQQNGVIAGLSARLRS